MTGPVEGQSVTRLTGGGRPRGGESSTETEAQTPQETPEQTPEGQETGGQETGQENAPEPQSRREADLRQRVRTAEESSAADRELIGKLHRREAERLANQHLANGADLFDVAGVSLSDLLTEDGGDVDEEVIKAKCEELVSSRGAHFGAGYRANSQHGAGGTGSSNPTNSKPKTLGEQIRQQVSYGYDPRKSQQGKSPTDAGRGHKGTVRVTK